MGRAGQHMRATFQSICLFPSERGLMSSADGAKASTPSAGHDTLPSTAGRPAASAAAAAT